MTSTAPVTPPGMERGDVRPGQRLGRYEILACIAQGGMARVWAARQHGQRGFAKSVVIKTILPALASDPDFEAMFLDEAQVAALVHHPNVCEIFDLGEEQGVLYIAMEYVNGDSLARVVKPPTPVGQRANIPTPVNARIAARIIADACAGLHAAHELTDEDGNGRNVVHRDVSPQNILISVDGTVKVTDFGVVKALGTVHEATMAGQIKGKAAYMSPEQAGGGQIDRRSDIFALGICLYEATTGRRPFPGPGQIATLKQLMACQFERPSAVIREYPRELESIVMCAMAREPRQRFATADRMREGLQEWLAKSGPVVNERQLGAVVRERLAAVIEDRRVRIRKMMSIGTQSAFSPAEEGSGAPQQTGSGAIGAGQVGSSQLGSGARTVAPYRGYSTAPVSAPASSHGSTGSMPTVNGPTSLSYGPVPTHASSVFGTGPVSSAPYTPPPHITSTNSSLTQPPDAARSALLGVVIGVGAFALIAATGVGLYALITEPIATPVPSSEASEAVALTPRSSAALSTNAAAVIRLRTVVPRTGVHFTVDGQPLEGMTLPRPQPGEVRLLKALSDGYEEETLRIDDQTPEVLDVLLLEKGKGEEEASDTEEGAPQPAVPVPGPMPKAEPKKNNGRPQRPNAVAPNPFLERDIPANPFE